MNVALVVLIFSAISAAAVFGYIWRWFNQLKEERRKLSLEEEKRGETLVLGWVSLTTIAIFVGGLEIAAIVAWLGVASLLAGTWALVRHRAPIYRDRGQ